MHWSDQVLNDLTQLLLGIDRAHPSFEFVMIQQSATVIQAVTQLVQRASALGLSSILCGSVVCTTDEWLAPLPHADSDFSRYRIGNRNPNGNRPDRAASRDS